MVYGQSIQESSTERTWIQAQYNQLSTTGSIRLSPFPVPAFHFNSEKYKCSAETTMEEEWKLYYAMLAHTDWGILE